MAGLALILDLDGTLWDSAAWYQALAGSARASAGIPAARMLRSAGFTEGKLARAAHANPPPLYDGVAELIGGIAGQVGVVTNLPGWMVRPLLRAVGLADAFDAVVDYGATRLHKPKPEPLLRCAELLGRPPAQCLYVGDDPNDALAAKAAGMTFAWASWGYAQVQPVGCDLRLERVSDLARYLGVG